MTLVVLLTGFFRNFHVFSDRKIGNEFRPNAALLFPAAMSFSDYKGEDNFFLHPPPFFASLYVFSDYKRVDSILCCIRQHHAFVTFRGYLFWRHFVASATIIFSMYVFSHYKMSFPLLYVFSDHKKRGRQFVASVTFLVCLFWLQKTQWYLVSLEMLDALFLRKEKVVLAARHRHQRFTRGRIYYISICQGTLFFTEFSFTEYLVCLFWSQVSTPSTSGWVQ